MIGASFEQALSAMKNGGEARREGWGDGAPHVKMIGPPGQQLIGQGDYLWRANQRDILATDWEIL